MRDIYDFDSYISYGGVYARERAREGFAVAAAVIKEKGRFATLFHRETQSCCSLSGLRTLRIYIRVFINTLDKKKIGCL